MASDAVTKLLSRVACNRSSDELLKANLKKITDLGVQEIPQELLKHVIELSHDVDHRQEIMRHLRECLSEPTGKRWRRIYGGLVLIEKLAELGSPTLLIEVAHGYHFDLIQKVSFVEQFDAVARGCSDPRVGHLVRNKAMELKADLLPKLEKAGAEEFAQIAGAFNLKDTHQSWEGMSNSTGSTCASSSLRSASTLGSNGSSVFASGSDRWSGVLRLPWRLRGHGAAFSSQEASAQEPSDASAVADVDALAARAKLATQLQRITDFGRSEIPAELFEPVIEASYNAVGRRVILGQLRGCLEDTKWSRVYGAMCVVEHLLHHGSPLIFTEPPQDVDYSIVNEVWLSQFRAHKDWRAQSLLRRKASALHDKLVQQLSMTWGGCSSDDDCRTPSPRNKEWDPELFHLAQDLAHHHAEFHPGFAGRGIPPLPSDLSELCAWAEEDPALEEREPLIVALEEQALPWSRSISHDSMASCGFARQCSVDSDGAPMVSPCGGRHPSSLLGREGQDLMLAAERREQASTSFCSMGDSAGSNNNEDGTPSVAAGPFFTPMLIPAAPVQSVYVAATKPDRQDVSQAVRNAASIIISL
jgi:hypothetical protein